MWHPKHSQRNLSTSVKGIQHRQTFFVPAFADLVINPTLKIMEPSHPTTFSLAGEVEDGGL
jgi:hypothetical protein